MSEYLNYNGSIDLDNHCQHHVYNCSKIKRLFLPNGPNDQKKKGECEHRFNCSFLCPHQRVLLWTETPTVSQIVSISTRLGTIIYGHYVWFWDKCKISLEKRSLCFSGLYFLREHGPFHHTLCFFLNELFFSYFFWYYMYQSSVNTTHLKWSISSALKCPTFLKKAFN